jgi:hypothetical protein
MAKVAGVPPFPVEIASLDGCAFGGYARFIDRVLQDLSVSTVADPRFVGATVDGEMTLRKALEALHGNAGIDRVKRFRCIAHCVHNAVRHFVDFFGLTPLVHVVSERVRSNDTSSQESLPSVSPTQILFCDTR